ncbi:hypothetical protein ACP70R_024886 [Stipagrostis hirtigluma subsp. patula]
MSTTVNLLDEENIYRRTRPILLSLRPSSLDAGGSSLLHSSHQDPPPRSVPASPAPLQICASGSCRRPSWVTAARSARRAAVRMRGAGRGGAGRRRLMVSLPVEPTSELLHMPGATDDRRLGAVLPGRARAGQRCGTEPQAAPPQGGRGGAAGRLQGRGAAARRPRRDAGARAAAAGRRTTSVPVLLPPPRPRQRRHLVVDPRCCRILLFLVGGGGGTALSGGHGSSLVAAPALLTEAAEAAR